MTGFNVPSHIVGVESGTAHLARRVPVRSLVLLQRTFLRKGLLALVTGEFGGLVIPHPVSVGGSALQCPVESVTASHHTL